MLQSVPFMVLVFGTPIALVAFIPAILLWNRLMRRRVAALGALALTPRAAAELEGRLRSSATAAAVAVAAGVAAGVVCVVAGLVGRLPEPRLLACAGPASAVAGLLILAAWPSSHDRVGSVPWSRAERRAVGVVMAASLVLAVALLLAAAVSVRDPDADGQYLAYPQASVVDWYYSYEGQPKDIEYTAFGVTPGWPGWFVALPALACVAAIAILALTALWRVHRWAPLELAEGRAGDDAARLLRGVLVVTLSLSGLALLAAVLSSMTGEVLRSISLYPKVQTDWRDPVKHAGYKQPLGTVGLVLTWLWPVLALAALIGWWITVFIAQHLRSAVGAAGRAMARGATVAS